MVVAVGEACKMVWEGVGSARGRPQAGRTSRQERERGRGEGLVVCHEAERAMVKRGTRQKKKKKKKKKMKNKKKRRRKRREGKINDEARGAKTVEKGKSRRRFPLSAYGKGRDEEKGKTVRWKGEKREREREREGGKKRERNELESWIPLAG